MDLRSLRYFVETVRLNSFTQAAETLHVTQSTISKMVRQLEDEVGAPLLIRDGRKLTLTDTGAIVYARGQDLLATMAEMTLELRDTQALQRGSLTVGIPPMINLLFTPVLKAFRQRHPAIALTLREDTGQAIERQVAAGELEIGLTVLPADPLLALETEPIASYPIWAVAAHGTFPKTRSTLKLTALAKLPLVLLKDDFALTRSLRNAFRAADIEPAVVAQSGQWDWLVAMASAGMAWRCCRSPLSTGWPSVIWTRCGWSNRSCNGRWRTCGTAATCRTPRARGSTSATTCWDGAARKGLWRRCFVDRHTLDRVDLLQPRAPFDETQRVVMAGLPALADAVGAEVDVLGVILAAEARRLQRQDVHRRAAAPRRQLAHFRPHGHVGRQVLRQLADHVAQAVQLALLLDVAGAAGVLDFLVLVEHKQHAVRLAAVRIPHLHREDHRAAARLVVQHRLDRCVRINAAVPVWLAVDAHGRKRRRQRARRHHVRWRQRLLVTVEIAHRAAARVDGADGQARVAGVEVVEIDQRFERRAQRRGLIKGRALGADLGVQIPPRGRIRREERRYALPHDHRVGVGARQAGQAERILLHAVPELAQPLQPQLRRIAGDDGAVDGADRCADHPIRLQPRLVHGLVDAELISPQRAAALQHQHDLAGDGGLVVEGLIQMTSAGLRLAGCN